MKFEIKNNWPVDTTRFLLPTIALRGFPAGPRTVTLAWWTWRLVVSLGANPATTKKED